MIKMFENGFPVNDTQSNTLSDVMENSIQSHWEAVYTNKAHQSLSWFQHHPTLSLQLVEKFAGKQDWIIDIGGGVSSLIEHLSLLGYRHLAMLDIAGSACRTVQQRLGESAASIEWFAGCDVRQFAPTHRYQIWHDRAVFHFMTNKKERQAYINVLTQALHPRGYAIVATFAPDGPNRCSGLNIRQYDASSIVAEFGNEFSLIETSREKHVTPSKQEQSFMYFVLQYK